MLLSDRLRQNGLLMPSSWLRSLNFVWILNQETTASDSSKLLEEGLSVSYLLTAHLASKLNRKKAKQSPCLLGVQWAAERAVKYSSSPLCSLLALVIRA